MIGVQKQDASEKTIEHLEIICMTWKKLMKILLKNRNLLI
jgi:hypothetical protein